MNTQNPQTLLDQAQLIHTSEAVQNAISQLSKEVTLQFEHTCPIVICVMGGGIVFAGQLLTQLTFPLELDYVHASRYQNNTPGGGGRRFPRPGRGAATRGAFAGAGTHRPDNQAGAAKARETQLREKKLSGAAKTSVSPA